MTSLLNQSGLNFQNGNPLGRKVRALEADVDMLKKELILSKAGGSSVSAASVASAAASSASASSAVLAEIDALKRELAMIKMAGVGKGEKGDRGEKGDKGDKGDRGEQGPMTYIAMPANATMPMVAPAAPTSS
jgi:hypothetical protein